MDKIAKRRRATKVSGQDIQEAYRLFKDKKESASYLSDNSDEFLFNDAKEDVEMAD